MRRVRIGKHEVGEGCPAMLVAEIGINHNGDMALARAMIDAAADAGATAVKFQNYRTEDFVRDRSLTYSYRAGGREVTESQDEMFRRCELSPSDLTGLRDHCADRGVMFHGTPTSEAGVCDLIELGAPVLKNGSDYLTHLPLIRAMGASGLPTVLSTGMATLAEIDDAVKTFRETGNERLILLHCTSSYPTKSQDTHLRKIQALASAFGCPVGFSDHTDGTTAAIAAVALGACWIEKHFTIDKSLPGPDQAFSADATDFRALVGAVRRVEAQLGKSNIGPTVCEQASREGFRLSCVAACDLQEGEVLSAADMIFARPGTGLAPKNAGLLIGRRLTRKVNAGDVLSLAMLA